MPRAKKEKVDDFVVIVNNSDSACYVNGKAYPCCVHPRDERFVDIFADLNNVQKIAKATCGEATHWSGDGDSYISVLIPFKRFKKVIHVEDWEEVDEQYVRLTRSAF